MHVCDHQSFCLTSIYIYSKLLVHFFVLYATKTERHVTLKKEKNCT